MDKLPQVVVAVARCQMARALFGLRFEEKTRGQWLADWAFQLPEARAGREGFNGTQIQGAIDLDPAYPGCPGCGSPSIFQCGCGKLNCWDGRARRANCAWCGAAVTLSGQITAVGTGRDA